MEKELTDELQARALCVRRNIVSMPGAVHDGYLFSAVSSVDILVWLYGGVLRVDPLSPSDEGRDRFVLSRISAAPALYATLAEYGFFPRDELWEYRRLGSMLQSTPEFRRTPGVDVTCGLPGIGLGTALGLALTLRDAVPEARVVCLLGADELTIGATHEALTFAVEAALPNLLLIVEAEGGAKADIPLRAAGCRVVAADGHDMGSLDAAWRELTGADAPARLRVLSARTVRARGLPRLKEDLLDGEDPLDCQATEDLISEMKA